MKAGFWVTLAMLGLTAFPAWAEEVPGGVYDCFGPELAGGKYLDLDISGAKFSVLDSDRYLSRGGETGHFSFDGFTLSLVDGPYAGLRFHKVSDWSFRMLRPTGEEGPFMCPHNTAKDPNKPKAW